MCCHVKWGIACFQMPENPELLDDLKFENGTSSGSGRLEELHRLLKNRKGSFCATCNKNAEAHDRAYDLNLSSCAGMFS